MRGPISKSLLFIVLLLTTQISIAAQVWQKPSGNYKFDCGRPGGSLILYATSDPKSFNPIVAKETSTTQITSYLFEGLTRVDPRTLKVIPNLAKSWQNQDGRRWIFHLRKDVYWSDGHKFTAGDVTFTFNNIIYNPKIPTGTRDIFTIEGKKIKIKAVDDYTVEFILPSVFSPFLRALSQDILPRHKYLSLVSKDKFTFSMGLDSKPEDIVGTGPFRLKKYLAGERVVLERNPYYWKKDACGNNFPYLDEIIFIILPNPETALLKFLEGELDYYSLRPQDLAILGPRKNKDFTIYNAGIAFGSNFLVFNENPAINPRTKKHYVEPYKLRWFRDKRFRKAVSFAVNRRKIIEIVMNGLGVPQYSPLSPANTLFYSDNVIKYLYDPAKAKDILYSLGFRDADSDGVLEDKHGNKLEINLFTNANSPERITIAVLIKEDLGSLGFKVNFMPLDFNNLVTKLTATFDWEAVIIGLTGGIEPYFGKNVWSYKGDLHAWNPTKKALDDYELKIDDIFNKSAKTLDMAKRKELFNEWQYIVSDNLPFIYTVQGYSIYAVRNRFGNLFPTVYGGAFSEIERVYVLDKAKK
ncbi:MAG: hypothetical protein B1H08_03590 [Candidatus Omnitrophica bacterium 4484_171]|nr:MAG: hypothetical protein B1H08_03590 [Candidatus Omnitrophica bacterium 4484_171]